MATKYSGKGTSVYFGVTNNPTTVLVSGNSYLITNYVAGDDFANVGGTNATGNFFTASGTTPTAWANGSTLVSLERILSAGDIDLDLGERVGLLDVTTQDNSTGVREKLDAGFKEPAKISFELIYDPADPVHAAMRACEETHAVRSTMIRLTSQNKGQWYGLVRVASFTIGAPVADKLTARVVLELLALATFTAP